MLFMDSYAVGVASADSLFRCGTLLSYTLRLHVTRYTTTTTHKINLIIEQVKHKLLLMVVVIDRIVYYCY